MNHCDCPAVAIKVLVNLIDDTPRKAHALTLISKLLLASNERGRLFLMPLLTDINSLLIHQSVIWMRIGKWA